MYKHIAFRCGKNLKGGVKLANTELHVANLLKPIQS